MRIGDKVRITSDYHDAGYHGTEGVVVRVGNIMRSFLRRNGTKIERGVRVKVAGNRDHLTVRMIPMDELVRA